MKTARAKYSTATKINNVNKVEVPVLELGRLPLAIGLLTFAAGAAPVLLNYVSRLTLVTRLYTPVPWKLIPLRLTFPWVVH